jgi:hypothetical protein
MDLSVLILVYLGIMLPLYLAMLSLSLQRKFYKEEALEYRQLYLNLLIHLKATGVTIPQVEPENDYTAE